MHEYIVIVPYKRKGKRRRYVSYPGSGQERYTRDKAIAILQRFHRWADQVGRPYTDSDRNLPWAEGPTERFNLFWLEDGRYLPAPAKGAPCTNTD